MFIKSFNDSEIFSKCELLIPRIPENNSRDVAQGLQKTKETNVRFKERSTWYYFEDIPNANSFCLSACFSNKDLVSGSSHSLGEKRPLLFNVRSMLVLVWPKHETTKNGEIKNRKIKALIVLLTHIMDWHIITRAYNCINNKNPGMQ